MSNGPIELPQVTIQHDFQDVIDDVRDNITVGEHVWLSCYKTGMTSLHTKLSVKKDAGVVGLVPNDPGLEFTKTSSTTFSVSYAALSISDVVLRSPRQILSGASQKPLSTFDVSPDGSLLASGHEDGAIVIQSTSPSNTDPSKQLTPHLATLLSVRFFPSNEVLLTSSSDFTLSIISAIDLSVPRKLKGHTRGVTDTAIISRGRNILSSGKDGTLRLWDVGGGKQIKVMGMPTFSPVNKISLGTIGDEWVHPPPDGTAVERAITTSPNEVETSDKAVYCALQNGQFSIIDLGTKSPVFTSSPSPGLAEANAGSKTALNAIAYLASHSLLATGTTGGLISLFDTRHLSSPLFVCQRNTASIEDLIFSVAPDPKLLVATEDGLPFCLDIKPEGPRVVEEFVGWDSEAIRGVRYAAGAVWCAGQDGIVRKY